MVVSIKLQFFHSSPPPSGDCVAIDEIPPPGPGRNGWSRDEALERLHLSVWLRGSKIMKTYNYLRRQVTLT